MKRSILTALILIAAGAAISLAVLWHLEGDYEALSSAPIAEHTCRVDNFFQNIDLDLEAADVELAPSPNGRCYVVCREYEHQETAAAAEHGTLRVKQTDNRAWHERIGIYVADTRITVYLPQTEYARLTATAASGDIRIPAEFRFQDADVHTASGRIDFSAAIQRRLSAESVSGDIALSGVMAQTLSCKTVSGDITLSGCDADSLGLTTASGDVTGTLLSEKNVVADTASGTVNIPVRSSGGLCEIRTVSGDITIKIQ